LSDPEHAGLLGRLVAHLHGEVAADALEAYRRAGTGVYDLTDDLDRLRLEAIVDGGPWQAPPATKTALLCGWNAFALQLVGDQLLEADYRCEPRTVGFVVAETAEQALAYYAQVAGWLSRAMQAIHNPNYDLDAAVPAPLPPWVEVGPECPDGYVEGLLAGLRRLRVHAEAALGEFRRTCGDEQPHAHSTIEGVAAEAAAAADYAEGLGAATADAVRGEVLAQARVALERYYLLGQLVAMPHLATRPLPKPARPSPPSAPRLLPGPGQKGFDPWCLSDPRVVKSLKKIDAAKQAIKQMWAADPDPARTLALRGDIDAGLYRDDIAYDSSHYFACPWSPVYVAKRPVKIGAVNIHPLQTFTLAIDTSGKSKRFRRHILVGSFYRAGRVGYWGG
jgi:hypothetical protein